jgi:hypothetical protein
MKSLRFILAASFLGLAIPAFAQTPCPTAPVTDHGKSVDGKPLASPPADAVTTLDGKAVKIHYNAPSMRCRKIFGGLLPYDHWWRTGADPATSFVTAVDLKIGTLDVPAGSYTLYSVPEQAPLSWILIVNKQTGQWGTIYDPKQDLGRTEMKLTTLKAPQELMSISFENVKSKSAELHVKWETTDAWVKIVAK